MTSKKIKLAGSFGFGAIIALILLAVLVCRKDLTAWLLSAFGLAAGWPVGILLAPYQSEQDRFREYLKIVSAFITGWAVSKLDRLLEIWFDPARGLLILDHVFSLRVLICVTSFFLAATLTYVSRKYLSFGPGAEVPRNSSSGNV